MIDARWDVHELPAALGSLGRPVANAPWIGGAPRDAWLQAVGAEAGFELQRVAATPADLRALIGRGAPAVAQVGLGDQYLVLVGADRLGVTLLTPALQRVRVAVDAVFDELCDSDRLEPLLTELPPAARAVARRALVERLGGTVGPWWLCRPPVDAPIAAHLREQGVFGAVVAWLASHLVAYGLWVGSFVWVGRAALGGALELGWIAGWALLLASIAPVRAATVWLQGRIATAVGVVLKQRLLVGALASPLDDVRTRGVGTVLGRVQDAEVLERLALDGGFGAVLALVEYAVTLGLLGWGGRWVEAAASVAFVGATAALGYGGYLARREWVADREGLTRDLVENLLGHATRSVQAAPARWHDGEDAALERYLFTSRRADGWQRAVRLVPAVWLPVAVATLAPSFVAGTATTGALAAGLGAAFLVSRALDGLARGVTDLASASIAWGQVSDLLERARTPPAPAAPEVASVPAASSADPVLELRGAGFRYPGAPSAVLSGVELAVMPRDRVLVQGASGGGKSTLSAMILGLRAPTSGTVLLGGLDRSIWGAAGWRQRVTGAPQFHENHLLAGTLAFNVLLGRRWPPEPADLDAAVAVCHQLGLGPLLTSMPAGIHQLVGETGWQLSHGERSRVYLARALLQDARVVVLDESTGALDAQATEWCLYRAYEIPGALIVVAHP